MANSITPTPLHHEIFDSSEKAPREVLKAFIRTNRAFESVMRQIGCVESPENWDRRSEASLPNATILDLPTYSHLPDEFLWLSENEKLSFIKELCAQHPDIDNRDAQKTTARRDEYIETLYHDVCGLFSDHLPVTRPERFRNMHLSTIDSLLEFMNVERFRSESERFYHCMFLKSLFLMHVIRSSIDLEDFPKVLTAIRSQVEHHPNITKVSYDEVDKEMIITYSAPWASKPRLVTITFGEKNVFAIFDKLARKPSYMSPDMLNDLTRINIRFDEDFPDDNARAWLVGELCKMIFGKNHPEIEMSTRSGYGMIIHPELLGKIGKTRIRDIPDIHNVQFTGTISPDLPKVRGIQTFELMCTTKEVDWNAEGRGNRGIYKVERLQQAFSRLATGGYGILRPNQVKYALQEYAQQKWVTETPEELFRLLVIEKGILIPINMYHNKHICYRVRGIYRDESKPLLPLQIEDLDITDQKLYGRLHREFRATRLKKPPSSQ